MYHGDRSRKEVLVGVRVPAAVGARQPAAELRGMGSTGRPGRLRVGDARALRAGEVAGRRRRADHPADRADRSADRRAARSRGRWTICCRRSGCAWPAGERVLVTTLTKRMAEDLTQVLSGAGRPGPLPALRHRNARAHRDPARPAARRVRRARRHQPAAGGAGPARGLAGGDSRRRQGGIPALGRVADPDVRPRGPQRQRARHHVR